MVMVMVVPDDPFDDRQSNKTTERPRESRRLTLVNGFGQNVEKYGGENRACSETRQCGLMPEKPALRKKAAAQSSQAIENDRGKDP